MKSHRNRKLHPRLRPSRHKVLLGTALLLMLLPAACQPGLFGQEQGEWFTADVGTVSEAGAVNQLEGQMQLVVTATGRDDWDVNDAFTFFYVPVNDPFVEIEARILNEGRTDPWAHAGVMIRRSLDAAAPHTMISFTPQGRVDLVSRSLQGDLSSVESTYDLGTSLWVRLQRTGSSVAAFVSSDGRNWRAVGETRITLDPQALIGVAVASDYSDEFATAYVDSVRVRLRDGRTLVPPYDRLPAYVDGGEATPPTDDGTTEPDEPQAELQSWVCPSTPLEPAYEPTLFVSTSGSDASDGRTESRPLRTLQAAAAAAGPGDVIWVRGGVYDANARFTTAGTQDAPIVVESYPGECAILDGSAVGAGDRVGVFETAHVTLRNFVIRGAPTEGILMADASNVTLSNLRVHGNYLSGITNIRGDSNRLTRILAYDNHDVGYGGDADGISISSGTNHVIEQCVVYENSDDGLDTWQSVDTRIDRCIAYANGLEQGDGNGIKAGGPVARSGTVVTRSIAFQNRSQGFTENTGIDVTFDQNTSFANEGFGFVAVEDTLRNNASIGNGRGVWYGASENNVEEANSWNLGLSAVDWRSTDPTNPDFLRPSSTGGAVDVGVDVGLPFEGAAPDVGALEAEETIRSAFGIELGSDLRP